MLPAMDVADGTTDSFYTFLGSDARGSSKPSGNPNNLVESWSTVELANSVDHEVIGHFLTSSTSLPANPQPPSPCGYWNVQYMYDNIILRAGLNTDAILMPVPLTSLTLA